MDQPFLYKEQVPALWTLRQVAELVQEMIELGCANDLIAQADKDGIVVHVPPETINFVKKFLFGGRHDKDSELIKDVIRSAACIPRPLPPGGPPVFPPPGPGDPPPM
jgi:hypothetical protein